MTTKEREENCRKIAAWLGFKIAAHAGRRTVFAEDDECCLNPLTESYEIEVVHRPECVCPPQVVRGVCISATIPNFYEDEAANAMLRRKARLQLMIGHVYLYGVLQDEHEYWFAGTPNEFSARNLDIRPLAWDINDKVAVVNAALKLIAESERQK